MVLSIGKEYNLNNVKEISVTDEFLTLYKTIIKCQNEESLQDCKTRKYNDAKVEQCKCLPFAIRNDEVNLHHKLMAYSHDFLKLECGANYDFL